MVRRIDPNSEVIEFFYHPNTGVSSWTVELYKDSIANNNTVTITEPETNFYEVRFSVDSTDGAIWHLCIYETANPQDGVVQGTFLSSKAHKANLIQVNGVTETLSKTLSYIRNTVDTLLRR